MLKLRLVPGSWILVFGLSIVSRADAGEVHIRWGDATPERQVKEDVKLYDNLVATRDANPSKFDQSRPFYGRLLTNSTFANGLVQRWEAHERCFERDYPCLSRILDGMAHLLKSSPVPPSVVSPPPSGISDPPHSQPGGGSTSVTTTSATPEPSTWVLMVSGISVVSLAMLRRRTARRPCLIQ